MGTGKGKRKAWEVEENKHVCRMEGMKNLEAEVLVQML